MEGNYQAGSEQTGENRQDPREGMEVSGDLPLVLTVNEARQVLRLGRNSMYEALRCGIIPSIRVGRRILIPRAALLRLLQGPA